MASTVMDRIKAQIEEAKARRRADEATRARLEAEEEFRRALIETRRRLLGTPRRRRQDWSPKWSKLR